MHTRNMLMKHEGSIYTCETCNAQFNQKGSLSRHIKSTHQGEKKFPCGLCDYQAIQKCDLSKHKKAAHHIINQAYQVTKHID